MFGGLPATGAIARTATNIRSGARTPVAGMIHALTLLAVLLFGARLAGHIPMAVLAAILFVVAANMGEWHEIPLLLRQTKTDVSVWLVTFALTVFADLTVAVEVGMILAALLFIRRVSSTTTVVEVTDEYLEEGRVHILQDKHIPDYVTILRIHGPFLFGATDKLQSVLDRIDELTPIVIFRLRNMTAIDATGLRALEDMTLQLRSSGRTAVFCGAREQPQAVMEQTASSSWRAPRTCAPTSRPRSPGRASIHDRLPPSLAPAALNRRSIRAHEQLCDFCERRPGPCAFPTRHCRPATASSRGGMSPTCRRRRRSACATCFKVIGPGAIMAATSIGGGEWLVGPAAAVKYSSAIFLIATVAILLQVIFNLEAIRYTLYTGEPIYGGIMRLKPGPSFWAAFYTVIGFFQLGWPALAGSAAATLLGAWMGRMPGAPDQAAQAWVATGLILFVVLILSFGGTIERMLEYFAWTMLGVVFLFLIVINLAFVPMSHWWQTFIGFFSFTGLPQPDRLGAHRRARRHGRLGRPRQPHRDQLDPRQGLRHGRHGRARSRAPSAAMPSSSRTSGTVFPATPAEPGALARVDALRARRSALGVGRCSASSGMFLNVNLATAIIPHGTDLQGLAAGAYQAEYLSKIWPGFWFLTLFNGFWILFKTQLGNTDILVRTITDAVWMSSSARARMEDGHPRDLLRHPGRLLHLGGHRDPLGVAVPAVQDPGEHGRHRAAHRRHPDLPRQPPVPAEGRARSALARDRASGVLGVLRVLRLLRRAGPGAVVVLGHGQHDNTVSDREPVLSRR